MPGNQKEREAAEEQAQATLVHPRVRRSSIGRALAAFAVFAPALFILGLFLLSKGSIYNHHYTGHKWPWIVADLLLLLVGFRKMRGEDL